ncbi:DUF2817 domain-containing protein [Exilibacterium tricleocarpae]|uniref:DUF2817 domain-containing protein n=1 Tax=Exilibacterium tricleocarpae TaxID=2591008 RepID=A0A545TAM6_9GAMM|nr:M14 family zinc carboxypeptidase [Exilibacterium tricleocarpae]TQV74258.1 DUF2817 domain-containing protein [Exilibacterium tricleocarpae]
MNKRVVWLPQELRQLRRLLRLDIPGLRSQCLAQVTDGSRALPVEAVSIGGDSPGLPTVLLVGGVHGVERIGAQVVLAYLESLLRRLHWDEGLAAALQKVRLVFVPVLNPVGVIRQTRSNGNGVDLMRNAPVDAEEATRWPLGGQYLSPILPWYRGRRDAPMEAESQALCDLVERLWQDTPLLLALDVHSGFGAADRLWFPLAGSRKPVPHLPEYYALERLLRRSHPHHDYLFEPQSHHYLCHGDLWDYLYLKAQTQQRLLLPLTLEMGSWRWVKKNPLQLKEFAGIFHPVKPHRVQRVLRRHTVLLEFLWHAALSRNNWLPDARQRSRWRRAANRHWYTSDSGNSRAV